MLPPPARPQEEAGGPHTVPEGRPAAARTENRERTVRTGWLEPGRFRRAFSWASAVSGANTGMHILLYVLCFLFLDTFDFFT